MPTMSSENFWAKKPFRMLVKISFSTESVADGRQSMWKCRISRGVTSLRPPPGGAAAPAIMVSQMSFQKSFSRSQKPL